MSGESFGTCPGSFRKMVRLNHVTSFREISRKCPERSLESLGKFPGQSTRKVPGAFLHMSVLGLGHHKPRLRCSSIHCCQTAALISCRCPISVRHVRGPVPFPPVSGRPSVLSRPSVCSTVRLSVRPVQSVCLFIRGNVWMRTGEFSIKSLGCSWPHTQ